MQTLKTATIVALLMTVMYGGYVSLTTPPEQIPPEYRDLLVLDEDLGMGTQMPVGGTAFPGPSEFQPTFASSAVDAIQDARGGINRAANQLNGSLDGALDSLDSGFGTSFAPPATSSQPAASISLGPATGQQSANGFQNQSTLNAPAQLPRVTMPARTVSVSTNRTYPATEGSYQLPGPGTSQDNFDPNRGRAFGVPNALPEMPGMNGTQDIDVPQTQQVSLGADSLDPEPYIPEVVAPSMSFAPPEPVQANTIPRASKNIGMENAINAADRQYETDQLREALATLSVFYDTPNVLPEQRQQLLARLDPLARDVIYSPRHLLEQPHRVGNNETLMEVAEAYKVPWQLLANINGIQDPLVIAPGTDLKVVRGPFSARIDLSRKELTLFVGDMYAGRFPVEFGDSPMPRPGTFTVQDKQSRRAFQDNLGNTIPAGSPDNPYGSMWIGLGSQLCIHGSPSGTVATTQGCISLPGDLADDLFGILVQGSSITIRQ